MRMPRSGLRCRARVWLAVVLGLAWCHVSALGAPQNLGPYNATFLEGGVGLERALGDSSPIADAGAAWSMTGWLKLQRVQPGRVIIALVGEGVTAAWRGLVLDDGVLALATHTAVLVSSGVTLQPERWYAVAATYDGAAARLYVDGRATAVARAETSRVASRIALAPVDARAVSPSAHFGGSLAEFLVSPILKSPAEIHSLAEARPNFSLVTFLEVGVGWPWQEHAWRGLQEPQDPWTLPHGRAPLGAPHVTPPPPESPDLQVTGPGTYRIPFWHLAPAPSLEATGDQLSRPGYAERGWLAAVVPGTVLTTLIARGLYPDPDYGLNNLAIPDGLSRQDYWYRSVFRVPTQSRGRELRLMFGGINYAAQVWVNGHRVGDIRGAFTRGEFDVTELLRPGESNAIAVRISPPPHPGIPHEQSVAAGPGNNGGAMAIDGPTFIASEGWDWIPGIRDRNSGLWQDVVLYSSGALQLGDIHVVSHLPLPSLDTADIEMTVPVTNRRNTARAGTVRARFDDVQVEKSVTLQPGTNEVRLTAAEFPQLHVIQPRLWWPNGYGAAALHTLHVDVEDSAGQSDTKSLRFGIRELSYELSLFDHAGRLRRVEVDPTQGTARGERLVDVRHQAIKRTPQGWAESLTLAGETSPAVRPVASEALTPYLTLRVNGVPIAARGGSWGMDDSRKRIDRERLEPYFRMHRDAHLNIIRNWLGQNTEEVFYDLADENGLLILNDFWASTQDFQMEPEDPALFLANARDVIARYRNHPSIAVWFGRNEGVPQPIINEGLADLTATLDGTRYYTGSSNSVNLQGSGPYNYRPPEQYFTELARGFSVEVGTPSLSTLESLQASIPAADRWPLNDTYAYHDWHFGGNGDVATFMAALAEQHGAGISLEDFERKAQLMDYDSYRAVFEGFQAHLWTRNSGRLLWMTHPSWPSNTWQIYSSDYDTAAPYYAVKNACEPLHAQLNLPDFELDVVNTTRDRRSGLTLRAQVFSLDNRLLADRRDTVDAAANAVTALAPLRELPAALDVERVVLVRLELTDDRGASLSRNTYWQARRPADLRTLGELPRQSLILTAGNRLEADQSVVHVTVRNEGKAPVLGVKLTVLDSGGARVLPVYYDDNYLALVPGETRDIDIRCPRKGVRCSRIAVRGWNVVPREIGITNSAR